jgi:hypothetical protein
MARESDSLVSNHIPQMVREKIFFKINNGYASAISALGCFRKYERPINLEIILAAILMKLLEF